MFSFFTQSQEILSATSAVEDQKNFMCNYCFIFIPLKFYHIVHCHPTSVQHLHNVLLRFVSTQMVTGCHVDHAMQIISTAWR
jgi:hypothetical protein